MSSSYNNDEFFGEKPSGIKTFDAFPKTRQTYRISSSRGGALTVILSLFCIWLTYHELQGYLDGTETQAFNVATPKKHAGTTEESLQINLDITVAMDCESLQVSVQDAAMDHIRAGKLLTKDPTTFDDTSAHRLVPMGDRAPHVYDILRKAKKARFGPTRRARRSFLHRAETPDGGFPACRIYGSMAVNMVQGEIIITAAGHGSGAGIDLISLLTGVEQVSHDKFNFSHVVNELSFGEYYPKLVNPLDDTTATTEENLFKFQYYISIVPTVYSSETESTSISTNQYAVTEHSRAVGLYSTPGIHIKYGIEALQLSVVEHRMPFTKFAVRVINIIGGILVSGNWVYKLTGVLVTFFIKKKSMDGMINSREAEKFA